MEIAQIRYFLSVVRHHNFTRAAEELYTTQPTVSKQIAQLEKELGVQLFNRGKHEVTVTYAGQQLYPELKRAMELIDTAIEQVTKSADSVQGQINIGIGSMLDINHVLPGFFHDFSLSYPGITLSIHSYTFEELLQKLIGGELDVIFTYSLEQNTNTSLKRMTVSRSSCYLYYPVALVQRPQDELTLGDFVDVPFLKLKGHSPIAEAYPGVPFRNIIEASDMEALILSLEAGLGFCIIGKSYRINMGGNIRALDLSGVDYLPSVGTDAIWLRGNQKNALSILLEEMKKLTGCRM